MRHILRRAAIAAVLLFGVVLAIAATRDGDPTGAAILFGGAVLAALGIVALFGDAESRKPRGFEPRRKSRH
jgi:hypothetical protein